MKLSGMVRGLKCAGLTVCLFITLWIVFGPVLRAGDGVAVMGALCTTPLAIHVYRGWARPHRTRSTTTKRRPIQHGLSSLVRRQHSGGI